MSTTLAIESFSENNIRERSKLSKGADIGDQVLVFESTEGFAPDDIVYVGQLSREGCEKVVVQTVDNATSVTLVSPLSLPHSRFESVTSVVGDKINVYRAVNVNGSIPIDADFAIIATRQIDPDQLSTYYTDSIGNSGFWYRYTYYNPLNQAETDLDESPAKRGDDFGHYASLTEIRKEAGFDNALNLADTVIDQQRTIAESEINAALGGRYTVPFVPVPDRIHTLTIQLAAALLVANAYRGTTRGQAELKAAKELLDAYRTGDQTITDENGTAISTGEGISSWPGEDQPRAFEMGVRF
ncbi:phage protein Gp36 family protein [Mycolicibacterium sp. PDY-3]|uniref:phage protein Gp36 family protein n=1 Tax=Mycolicibacterium sp. PDY-3 TaxID=3376069 RepID=UPI003790E71F